MKKKRTLLGGAGIIMLATLGAKVLGALYRIPLTNMLGAEGMGVYQSVYPVYALILSVSGGAVPMAISVLVASYSAAGESARGVRLTLGALAAMLTTGAALTAALMLLNGVAARLQGTPEAETGYLAIAPSIFFVSGIAVLKGYFQGKNNMNPTALSQITEALGKLLFGMLLAWLLLPKGVEYAVAGALAGVSIGEGLTFGVLAARFMIKERIELKLPPLKEAKRLYKEILAISLPIGIGGMIFPLAQFLDSFTVINILSLNMPAEVATAEYGLLSAPVNTLVNLPVSLALGVGIAVAPHLAGSRAARDMEAIRLKLSASLKAAVALGVPFTALFLAAPAEVLGAIYPSLSASEIRLAAELLRIGAVNVVFLTLMQISVSVLQGLGCTSAPIKNLAAAGALKIVAGVALLFVSGIRGVMWANLAAYALGAALNMASVFNLTGKNSLLLQKSGVSCALGAIILVPTALASVFGLKAWAVLGLAAVSGIIYLAALVALPVFTYRELVSLPMGAKLARFNAKFHSDKGE